MFVEKAGRGKGDELIYPNPEQSFWEIIDKPLPHAGVRWRKQRELRSRILARARLEMAHDGLDRVTLRSIARHCNISVQTIYNLVGGRLNVLDLASKEWVLALDRVACARAAAIDISETLAILGMFWASPLHHSEYVAEIARTARTRDDPLNRAYRELGIQVVRASLQKLEDAGRIREWIDIDCLARQLIAITHVAIYYWTVDRYDIPLYWREFEHGPTLLLMGAVKDCEHEKIERGMQLIRRSHCELYRRTDVSAPGSW